MLIILHPAHRGASSGDVPRAERDAAPAGGARNPALGRPRDPTGRHYGRSAGSLLYWLRANAGFKKRGPGDRNRRDGAPRGAHPSPRVPALRQARIVRMRLAALHPLGMAEGDRREDGLPGAAKNTGGGALASLLFENWIGECAERAALAQKTKMAGTCPAICILSVDRRAT